MDLCNEEALPEPSPLRSARAAFQLSPALNAWPLSAKTMVGVANGQGKTGAITEGLAAVYEKVVVLGNGRLAGSGRSGRIVSDGRGPHPGQGQEGK
jgi:hypothetical protein